MARKPGGSQHIESAKELLRSAKTADEIRMAQSLLLPLELGLSLEKTAKAIGRSVGATCSLRMRYCDQTCHEHESSQTKQAPLRNRAYITIEQEREILDEILGNAMDGNTVFVPPLIKAIVEKLGKPVSPSTIYRMLARTGWKKTAPIIDNTLAKESQPSYIRGYWTKP